MIVDKPMQICGRIDEAGSQRDALVLRLAKVGEVKERAAIGGSRDYQVQLFNAAVAGPLGLKERLDCRRPDGVRSMTVNIAGFIPADILDPVILDDPPAVSRCRLA